MSECRYTTNSLLQQRYFVLPIICISENKFSWKIHNCCRLENKNVCLFLLLMEKFHIFCYSCIGEFNSDICRLIVTLWPICLSLHVRSIIWNMSSLPFTLTYISHRNLLPYLQLQVCTRTGIQSNTANHWGLPQGNLRKRAHLYIQFICSRFISKHPWDIKGNCVRIAAVLEARNLL